MLKTTDSRLVVPSYPQGVEVIPDELLLPIRLRSQGKGPLEAATNLAKGFRSAQEVAGELEPSRYRSWTEKLAGKSFGGHGVRHHAEALVLVRRTLDSVGFFERVQMLETLRAALSPLDDGSLLAVGIAEWRVSNPEQYRKAALQLYKERTDALCAAFGVSVERVDSSLELHVNCVNPIVAFVQLNLTTPLSFAA